LNQVTGKLRTADDTSPIGELLRELTPQVLGVVLRRFHDFSAAEDATQEASLAAVVQWPRDGVPDDPRAWLIQVALRRMTDQVRSDSARRRREAELETETARLSAPVTPITATGEDDTLVLLLMCCHPALTPSSAIALTLRAVGGLTTAEIASAFLVPEATMAQRISRAKQTIEDSGARFQMPDPEALDLRLRSALHVLYLIFNEGYTASSGPDLRRADLTQEGIRLTRMALQLAPDNPEIAGLLALMLLTDARRHARTGPSGDLISLAEQDRTLWDRKQIAEGVALLSAALPKGGVGPYQLQASIAAIHDEAERAEDTDWRQILALYDLLNSLRDNPMVMLSHAVAYAMVHGPTEGIRLLDTLERDGRVAQHHRFDAVRAHLLQMAGDLEGAATYYRSAASKAANYPERDYLLKQAARLDATEARA
jgi:RNA polymerase sigma factor (sigma-70 family)